MSIKTTVLFCCCKCFKRAYCYCNKLQTSSSTISFIKLNILPFVFIFSALSLTRKTATWCTRHITPWSSHHGKGTFSDFIYQYTSDSFLLLHWISVRCKIVLLVNVYGTNSLKQIYMQYSFSVITLSWEFYLLVQISTYHFF